MTPVKDQKNHVFILSAHIFSRFFSLRWLLLGAIRGWEDVTLRLMFTALASDSPLSGFFPPSVVTAGSPPFPVMVTELEALWLGVLMSGVGWMETGVCLRLRAWSPVDWVEDVAPWWLRRARFWTWEAHLKNNFNCRTFVHLVDACKKKWLTAYAGNQIKGVRLC